MQYRYCTVLYCASDTGYCAQGVKCAVLKHSIDHKVEAGRSWLLEGFTPYNTARAGEGKGKTWEGMLTLWDERTHHVVVRATIL